MITNRPAYLIERQKSDKFPPLPIRLDLDTVPNWIKLSLLFLGGVQPKTEAMAEASDYILDDWPSPREVELFERRNTKFQIISIVASIAGFRADKDTTVAVPYQISLIPATKRDLISSINIDYVQAINLDNYIKLNEPSYSGYDPFSGDWIAFGPLSLLYFDASKRVFPDQLGLVTDMYYLQTDCELDSVLAANMGMNSEEAWKRYLRHRNKILFTPFSQKKPRRVWGAESPIELFLFQGLLSLGLTPNLQTLIFEDGSVYPSLYCFWAQNHSGISGALTEADLYFPDHKVALFCDSTRYHRGTRNLDKDKMISEKLGEVGIRAVRIPGPLIVKDLKAAIEIVLNALK